MSLEGEPVLEKKINRFQNFLILIPCAIDYVEINILNALNYITLYFSFTVALTCFGKKNVILRERLCSFLSHFCVNIVGDKLKAI
jgi:hypothetical protein